MNYPSKAVAEIARWAKKHGCVYEGVAQSGHVKFLLPNGDRYTTSASPSDRNVVKIVKRALAKRLGIRLENPRAGRYKHTAHHHAHRPAVERVESVSAQYDRLTKRHRMLCDAVRSATAHEDDDARTAALTDLADVEQSMTKLGRRPPLRTYRA